MVGIVHLPLLCPCCLIMEADKSRERAVMMAGNVDCREGRMAFCYFFFQAPSYVYAPPQLYRS